MLFKSLFVLLENMKMDSKTFRYYLFSVFHFVVCMQLYILKRRRCDVSFAFVLAFITVVEQFGIDCMNQHCASKDKNLEEHCTSHKGTKFMASVI